MKGRELVAGARAYCEAFGLKDPSLAFSTQRKNARERGIEWEMTFDEWWTIWRPYYHMRGRGTNELCMAREGDQGAYKVGNVYLTTHLGNSSDYHGPRREAKKAQQERNQRYWGRNDMHSEAVSHRAYKICCNPQKFVAE